MSEEIVYGLHAVSAALKHEPERVVGLWVDRKTGTGVAYFSTGNDAPPAGERSAFSRVEEMGAVGW